MAFTYTANKKVTVTGDLRCVIGTYDNSVDAATGGAIITGLNEIFFFDSNYQTSQATTVNKTVISGGTATITTVASEVGQWIAWGV
jgi:hypothetical protein